VKTQLEHQHELLALALDATSDGIWTWHIPTGEAFFSPRYFTMLGYEPDELPSAYDTWVNLLHPEDREGTECAIRKHITDGVGSYEVEFRLRTKANDWVWILGRGEVIERGADGSPELVAGSHVNIDKRKRTEEKLARYRESLEEMVRARTRELEETSSLLEATFDAIPDILGVQDHQHRIIRYNEAGYRSLDMNLDEVEGQRCFELIGRHRECVQCATSECYRTKKPAALTRYEEALGTWLDVRAYPVLDDDGNIVRVIEHLRDITAEKQAEAENRELQDQLQHVQKMESLGTLAGGIAHDFNNLLMGIQGRASLLSLDLARSGVSNEHVEAIEGYVRNAADLTKQLLGFARRGKYEVKPLDINELVVTSANMFGRTRKGIEIQTDVDPEPLIVSADRGQLERVLLNMYINAWQAMPDSGELRLETSVEHLDIIQSQAHQIEPGRYCRISITDTGVGMDETTRQRVFDPFFTTKDKGRGTGLGLASAFGIVTNHGGTISVDSHPGEGTVFSVYLPLSTEESQTEKQRIPGTTQGDESILMVDDEQMILDVGKAMLENLGYQVITAGGGREAITAVADEEAHFDLVILDLVMPGMNGAQVYERLRSYMPETPVLLSSGYSLDGQAESLLEKGCQGFIQKPFSIVELSQHVRGILDSREGDASIHR